jgi:hypothetical protein
MRTMNHVVQAAYYQFYVQSRIDVDASVVGEVTDGLISPLGAGGFAVATGAHTAAVGVSVTEVSAAPDGLEVQPDAGPLAISEMDVFDDGSGVSVVGWGASDAFELRPPGSAGVLRVRVYAAGRERGRELDVAPAGIELVQLMFWPVNRAEGLRTLRADGLNSEPASGNRRWTAAKALAYLNRAELHWIPGRPVVELHRERAVSATRADVQNALQSDWTEVETLLQEHAQLIEALSMSSPASSASGIATPDELPNVTLREVDGRTVVSFLGRVDAARSFWLGEIWGWWLERLESTVTARYQLPFRQNGDGSLVHPDVIMRRPALAHAVKAGGSLFSFALVDPDLAEALVRSSRDDRLRAVRVTLPLVGDLTGISQVGWVRRGIDAYLAGQPAPEPLQDVSYITALARDAPNLVGREEAGTFGATVLAAETAASGLYSALNRPNDDPLELLSHLLHASGLAHYRRVLDAIRQSLSHGG